MLAKTQGLFRLVKDAELRYSANGTAILKISLACSEKYKEKETQLFIDAVAFGKTAEILSQYAGIKGTQIFITGKLQTEQWTAEDGQKRSKISLVIEGFDFISGQNRQQTQPQAQGYQQPYSQPQKNGVYQQPQYQPQQQPVYEYQNAQGQPMPQQQQQPQQMPQQQYQQQQQPQPININEDEAPF